MPRWVLALFVAGAAPLCSQSTAPPPPPQKGQGELQKERPKPKPGKPGKEAVPAEEDKALATQDYAFNPLQAQKEVQTGNYYFKKGSYRAAAGRFREATRWNDGDSEAWLRLGEAEEKLKDPKSAREAYTRYLEMAADAKNAAEIRKRLDRLK
jgi:tetratricopeptide (TPR) repeat protein